MKILLVLGLFLVVIGLWLLIDGKDGFKQAPSKWNALKGLMLGALMLVLGVAFVTSWYALTI